MGESWKSNFNVLRIYFSNNSSLEKNYFQTSKSLQEHISKT